MIANKWYCIAQTGTFDSGCTINVSFDSYVIQFSASVKYGSSAINITRCELPLSANLSLRLRESNGLWSVDLLSNNDITPEIVVADSPYWTAVNSVAGAGNIILTLKDISKDFNTETGGSGGGLDENALRDFLDKYGYTQAKDFWKYEETGGGAIHTGYHIIVDGGGAFGGAELGGGGESGGGGISEFYIQLGEGGQKYKLGNSGLPNVVQIPKYPVVPTNVSEFYNDAGYIGREQAALIFSRISEVEGRVEKLEKLWWVDENGNLHTRYNIVVEGGGAFGTGASVDAGGSGGLGRVILVNDSGTEFTSDENGIVRIPDYINKIWFDAQKFATQSWVLSKGYVSESVLAPIREDITALKGDVAELKSMWTIKDGKLYTTYSIVVEGGGAFGQGASDSGGGSTGGLGQITIRNQAGQEYKTDANGVVVIPTYLTSNALDGYATQQWVESKKYLTSIPTEYITETELTAKGYAIASEIAKTYATIESLNTTNTNLATVTTGLANVATTVDALSKNFVNGIAKEAAKVSHALTFGSKTYDGSIARTILASDLDAVTLSGEQIITGAKTFGSLITANGGIKIPYTASLKIGDVTLVEDNGALKILGNLVVTGGGAFGDGASSGGGGGEGFSKIIIQTESGQSYTTNDAGVVTIPNYITSAALNGYATQSWVEGKKYLTGITSAMVTTALGYVPFNSTSFTKATIKSTLGIADWALAASKPAYTASEVGALSETGGIVRGVITLSGNDVTNVPLNIATPSMGYTGYIRFGGGFDTHELGHLGFSAKGVPAMRYGGVVNTLIHTGNYADTTDKRYLQLSGGTISGNIVWYKGKWGVDTSARGVFMSWNDSNYLHITGDGAFYNWNTLLHSGNYSSYALPLSGGTIKGSIIARRYYFGDKNDKGYGYLTVDDSVNSRVYYVDNLGAYNILVHSGNIGSYNAGSATKLQTARTIWGQSYDGTRDVSGTLKSATESFILNDSYENPYLRLYNGNATYGYMQLVNNTLHLGYGYSTNNGIYIPTSGNVLIGNTTDRGHKLAVIRENSTMTASTLHNSALFIGSSNSVDSYGLNLWTEGSGNGFIQQGRTDEEQPKLYNLSLQPFGGNVLIGTTTDSGYKLDVNGTSVVRGKASFRHTILADRYNGQGNTAGAAFIVNKGGDYFGVGASSSNISNISFGWVNDLEGTWKKELVTINASNNIILNQGVYISATDSAKTARGVLEFTTSQNRFIIGYGIANAGYDTSLQGNNIEFTYGTSHLVGMKLTSAGNVSMYGNLTVSGGGAFGSDVRYKHIINYTNIDLATIANAPLFTYRWNDREDKKVYLGTSAQYWLDTAFTNAVNTDNPCFYHLDYGALAVGIGIEVAREVKGVKTDIKGVKTEVEQLRDEVKQLKEKLNKYETLWHN